MIAGRQHPARTRATVAALVLLGAACGGEAPDTDAAPPDESDPATGLVDLLRDGHAVFGIFSGERTPEQGATMAESRELDFVFYSLEQGPFDLATLASYQRAMDEAAEGMGVARHPMALRIPPIGEDPEGARERTRAALDADMDAVVFPHVTTAADAALAVEFMGDGHWPVDPAGPHVSMLIVEDREGVRNVSDIASTPGVSVVFAGPGDLRRAYDGDMEAVEAAIQTVLAACREATVPCGITAGVQDIAERLRQGFRVIIVTEAEALGVGRAAANR